MLPEQTPGWDLLKPYKQIKGSDQLRLMNRLQIVADKNSKAGDEVQMDLEAVADFTDYVGEKFAIDPDVFDKWSMGPGGYNRVMTLALTYGQAMGE
jgi:hypothetical protein